MTRPQSKDSSVTIPGRPIRLVIVGVWLVFAIGVSAILISVDFIVTSPGLGLLDYVGVLLGVAAFIVGLVYLDRMPRRVVINPDTVEFHYLLTHVKLKWDQLAAPTDVWQGFVSFNAVPGTRGVAGPLTVTTEQARAILSSPACPHFNLPEGAVRELD
jgi:hypothetical protein